MKIIISLSIWSLFFSFSSYFFIGPEHSYSVLLPEGTELVQVDTLDGGIKNHNPKVTGSSPFPLQNKKPQIHFVFGVFCFPID